MAADLDMDASGGEGWGDDAELQLDEGKFSHFRERAAPLTLRRHVHRLISLFLQTASWMPRKD